MCGVIPPFLSYTFMEYTEITYESVGSVIVRWLAIDLTTKESCFNSLQRQGMSLFQSFGILSAFHRASCLMEDIFRVLPWGKQPVRQTYCSFTSSAEVNEWSCVSSPPICLGAMHIFIFTRTVLLCVTKCISYFSWMLLACLAKCTDLQ